MLEVEEVLLLMLCFCSSGGMGWVWWLPRLHVWYVRLPKEIPLLLRCQSTNGDQILSTVSILLNMLHLQGEQCMYTLPRHFVSEKVDDIKFVPRKLLAKIVYCAHFQTTRRTIRKKKQISCIFQLNLGQAVDRQIQFIPRIISVSHTGNIQRIEQ